MNNAEHHISDEELWVSVKTGSKSSFESLYNKNFKLLYNYGRKICHNPSQVEDAIHDLFFDLWRYRNNLATTTSVRFYLYRSLRRRIVKNIQKEDKSTLFDFDFEELFLQKAFSPEEEIINQESSEKSISRIKKLLNHLSPRQYESLVLRFYDDFSYEEIGALLEVNEQSARNLVQRGLEQLRNFSKIITSLSIVGMLVYDSWKTF